MRDLRRTAARDFIAADVNRADVKLLCGWNTEPVFEHYLIRNDADLAAAVAKRFTPTNGKPAANPPPSPAPAPR